MTTSIRFYRIAMSCLIIAFLISPVFSEETLTYYVAKDGSDDFPGTKAQPFASLMRARDAIRASRGEKNHAQATVLIGAGTYSQFSSLLLEPADSNTTYRAELSRGTILSGGITVKATELPKLDDDVVRRRVPERYMSDVRVIDLSSLVPGWQPDAPWPDAFRGYAGWPEVFIGGQPLRLARWPNNDYATIAKVVDPGSKPRFKEAPGRGGAFTFNEPEPVMWDNEQEIFLGGYWCFAWYDEVLRVKSIDRAKKVIRFAAPHHYGIGGQSKGKYYALNVLETLDQPGEYVYNRKAGKIYLIPPEGKNDCVISLLKDPIIKSNGADNIRFEGLQIEAGRGLGIELSDCTDAAIENCVVRNFPQFGIVINGGRRCGVVHSELYGMGKGGISLSGGDRKALISSAHVVTDCEIHDYARLVQTYQPAVRLAGVGQRVAFNFIHHAPHQAIGFSGNDHLIENNRIERVCLDTGDAGAIYCGRDWTLHGNIIQKNWFSQLGASIHHNNWAVYPDDQSSGVTAKHNIVINTPSGFLFGGGRDSFITENLFVRVGKWPIRFDKRGISWKAKHEKTLQEKLAKVAVDQEPWRTRFPTLVGLATNPNRNWPEGNVISRNIAVSSSPDNIDLKVKECGKVEDTIQVSSDWMPKLNKGNVIFPDGGPELPSEFEGLIVGPRPRK